MLDNRAAGPHCREMGRCLLGIWLLAAPAGEPAGQPGSGREQAPAPKSPSTAAFWSALFPGAGHAYLGDWTAGGIWMGVGALEMGAVVTTLLDGWPEDASGMRDDPTLLLALMWYQNTSFYTSYAAYRDARLRIGSRGYRYPTPEESLAELLVAPFDPDTFFRPEVALGLTCMLGLGLLASHLVEGGLISERGSLFTRDSLRFMGRDLPPGLGVPLGELYYLGLFTPVGIGEEAFFRGVIQPGLSEWLGKWGGWAAASTLFGLSHAPNALLLENPGARIRYLAIGLPFLTLFGGYLGWTSLHNDFSLKAPVALHFWYDFLLSSVSFALDPDGQPFAVRVMLPF